MQRWVTEITQGEVHLTFGTSGLPEPALACLISLGPHSNLRVWLSYLTDSERLFGHLRLMDTWGSLSSDPVSKLANSHVDSRYIWVDQLYRMEEKDLGGQVGDREVQGYVGVRLQA